MDGKVVYIELALQNVQTTLDFYKEIFHWTFEESFISSQKYIMFETPNRQFLGGLDANIKPSLDGPNVYLEVHDIDAVIKQVLTYSNTAIIKPKTLISEAYGSYALIQDPSGNKIGLQENSK